jgi:hypothetical protein
VPKLFLNGTRDNHMMVVFREFLTYCASWCWYLGHIEFDQSRSCGELVDKKTPPEIAYAMGDGEGPED